MLIRPDSLAAPESGGLPERDGQPSGGLRPKGVGVTVYFDGRAIAARTGDSVAAALLAGGVTVTRQTPVGSAPRGPYCMMGACFDCLAVVDGRPSVQTCMTEVREGMRIERQIGARGLATGGAEVLLDPSPRPPPSRGGGE